MNLRIKPILVFSLLFITSLVANQPKSDWSAVFEKTKNKVVQIFSYGAPFDWFEPYKKSDMQAWCGTGFFISPDGKLYTNFHVVNHAEAMFIQMPALGKQRFEFDFVGGS